MSKNYDFFSPERKNLQDIRFLILDVDGVMTDGSIIYDSNGAELKQFDVKDGSGIKFWQRAGHEVGIITGRTSAMVERRARELAIPFVEMGVKAKLPVFEKMLAAAGVQPHETAVIGDDLMDIPLIVRSGLGVAVADAVEEVKENAKFITQKKGGRGAVREVVENILKAQGKWQDILARYLA